MNSTFSHNIYINEKVVISTHVSSNSSLYHLPLDLTEKLNNLDKLHEENGTVTSACWEYEDL